MIHVLCVKRGVSRLLSRVEPLPQISMAKRFSRSEVLFAQRCVLVNCAEFTEGALSWVYTLDEGLEITVWTLDVDLVGCAASARWCGHWGVGLHRLIWRN